MSCPITTEKHVRRGMLGVRLLKTFSHSKKMKVIVGSISTFLKRFKLRSVCAKNFKS